MTIPYFVNPSFLVFVEAHSINSIYTKALCHSLNNSLPPTIWEEFLKQTNLYLSAVYCHTRPYLRISA